MATTAIWKVKGNLGQVVNYAANLDKTTLTTEDLQGLRDVMDYATQDYKTEEQRYVSGVNCAPEIARDQMMMVKRQFGKEGGIIAFHGYQSFAPGEVTPEQAHEIGVELAQRLWGERFQVVVATHLDREHIHNHFVLNSVSFVDGKKYNDCKSTYALMRQTSDQLCREHGLSVIETPEQGRTMSYDTWEAEQKGRPTWYGQIRRDVDSCIARSFLFEHFVTNLKKQGYEVKTGKYIAVRLPGKQRFVRLKTLGDDYTEEAIRERIRAHEQPPRRPAPRPTPKQKYRLQHKPKKLTGFRALYFHYLYLLGKLKKPTALPRRRRYMTDEIIKFDRYVEQAKLLMKYRIDTWEQLTMLEEAVQSELDAFCNQRKGLYTARRRNPTGTDPSPAIESINQSIKILRRELKVCGWIEADGPAILQKLTEPLPAPPKVERAPKQRPRKWQR
ncbi:MAG: relaxase/mobilization nuclease domain-containing protein [Clostridiales bacterium]|nr:relaxase/mobilization nuclease domain-containing protein [Clostridiales bacterium]